MSEKTYKWLIGALCAVSIVFAGDALRAVVSFLPYLIERGDVSETLGEILYCVMNFTLLASAVAICISFYRSRYSKLKYIYMLLAIVSSVITIRSLIMVFSGLSNVYIILVIKYVIVTAIPICLALSIGKCERKWIIIISTLMVLDLFSLATFAGNISDILAELPVLISGLLINVKNSKHSQYQDVTSALEELKKQFESGIISEQEYSEKKADLISRL